MLTIDIRLDKRSFERARDHVDRLIDITDNLAPTFEAVHPYLLMHQARQFATEGKHGGDPWVLLYFPVRAMQALLQPSLTEPGHQDHVFLTERDQLRFGTSSQWARRLFDPSDERERIFAMSSRQKKNFLKLILQDLEQRALQ